MFSLKCFADPLERGARSGARLFSSASRHTLSLKVILKIRPVAGNGKETSFLAPDLGDESIL